MIDELVDHHVAARLFGVSAAGQFKPTSKTYRLFYGSEQRPLATVVPDTRWPDMWRIVWPDGRFSDMVNLTRAMDAAAAIAERGPPGRYRNLLRWEIVCIEDGRIAPLVDLNAPPASSIDPGQQIESCTPITPSDDGLVDCPSPDDGSP